MRNHIIIALAIFCLSGCVATDGGQFNESSTAAVQDCKAETEGSFPDCTLWFTKILERHAVEPIIGKTHGKDENGLYVILKIVKRSSKGILDKYFNGKAISGKMFEKKFKIAQKSHKNMKHFKNMLNDMIGYYYKDPRNRTKNSEENMAFRCFSRHINSNPLLFEMLTKKNKSLVLKLL